MSASLTIRPAAREDYEAWKPLWDGYNAFYGREGPTALPEENTRMTWARFFDAYEPVHCLMAESEGGIVGIAHYLFHRSTIHIDPVCYMQDLFTSHAARGKGVGRALIEAVHAKAREAGSQRFYWHTRETNAVARALYDKVAQFQGAIVYLKS